jgi:hypothetical protein
VVKDLKKCSKEKKKKKKMEKKKMEVEVEVEWRDERGHGDMVNGSDPYYLFRWRTQYLPKIWRVEYCRVPLVSKTIPCINYSKLKLT